MKFGRVPWPGCFPKVLENNDVFPSRWSGTERKLMHARQLIAEVLRTSVPIPDDDVLLAQIEGWDSLKGVRLVLRLEELVGRELSEDDIENLQSVEDVDRLLKAA
jgi:acyl carrier protein